MAAESFVIDCPFCKVKVAAEQKGRVILRQAEDHENNPSGEIVYLGSCPRCKTTLVGESRQTHFADYDSEYDEWSDIIRVYPSPSKTFSSYRIPRVAIDSLSQGDRALQANACDAACVMFGRALEAVCRNILAEKNEFGHPVEEAPKKPLMLFAGIKKLREKNIIDERLFDWSRQLHAFRNMAAHAGHEPISREDAEDIKAFVYAIIEYIYDLTDRYEEFKQRQAEKEKAKQHLKKHGSPLPGPPRAPPHDE